MATVFHDHTDWPKGYGTLGTAINSSTTTFTLGTNQGLNFNAVGAGSLVVTIDYEQILCNTLVGDTFGVTTRGYNGTNAGAHPAGAKVRATFISKHLTDIEGAIGSVETGSGTLANLNVAGTSVLTGVVTGTAAGNVIRIGTASDMTTPPIIGGGTANAGSFTTGSFSGVLTAGSAASVTGVLTGSNASNVVRIGSLCDMTTPPIIGGSTANAGSFTTGSFSGVLTAGSTATVTGVLTGTNAANVIKIGTSSDLSTPPVIGGSTANAGSFTTGSFSGVLTAGSHVTATGSITGSHASNVVRIGSLCDMTTPPTIGGVTPAAATFTTVTAYTGSIVSGSATATLLNATATTVNAFGAATAVNTGATGGTHTFAQNVRVRDAGVSGLGTELVTNGNFEADANWGATPSPAPLSQARSNEQARGGTYSWKVNTNATYAGIYATTALGKPSANNRTYLVTGWIYSSASTSFDLYLCALSAPGTQYTSLNTTAVTANTWCQISAYVTVSASTAGTPMSIVICAHTASNITWYVDDVSVKEVGGALEVCGAATIRNGLTISGVFSRSTFYTFTANDTTPDVSMGNFFKVPSTWTAGNDITMFDGGTTTQEIAIIGGDSDCNVIDGGNLILAGNWTAAANATLRLVFDGTNWYELSRSAN